MSSESTELPESRELPESEELVEVEESSRRFDLPTKE